MLTPSLAEQRCARLRVPSQTGDGVQLGVTAERVEGAAVRCTMCRSLSSDTALDRLSTGKLASPTFRPPPTQLSQHFSYSFGNRFSLTQYTLQRFLNAHSIKVRFGAVGRKGSIAIIERFWRTFKTEGTRRTLIPYSTAKMNRQCRAFAEWYNHWRPHSSLQGASPEDVYINQQPPRELPRFELRNRFPISDLDLKKEKVKRAHFVALNASPVGSETHLPIVKLDFDEAA